MLIDYEIERFINELSSDSDTFGGGAVGGIVAAFGIGLILMSIKITSKRKSFEAIDLKTKEQVKKYIKSLEISSLGAKATVDADAIAFQEYMKAYRAKKQDLEQQAITCFDVPRQLANICVTSLSITQEFQNLVTGSIRSDLEMGMALLKVVLESALKNMAINLKQIRKPESNKQYLEILKDANKFGVRI
jgi:formiminotetrahydrofolate cyclodeaminase